MLKIRVVLFLLSLSCWLLLNWSLQLEIVIAGIAVSIFVAFMTGDIFAKNPHILYRASRYGWFGYYVLVFLWECIKANIDGAARVVHPFVPIRPGIVKVKTSLRSQTALTFLANTLTLKPGTMTIDVDRDNGILYVHWVDVKSSDIDTASELIIRRFEGILKKVFE
jgi:multicomponent Na+:H+ antiporter subunit E